MKGLVCHLTCLDSDIRPVPEELPEADLFAVRVGQLVATFEIQGVPVIEPSTGPTVSTPSMTHDVGRVSALKPGFQFTVRKRRTESRWESLHDEFRVNRERVVALQCLCRYVLTRSRVRYAVDENLKLAFDRCVISAVEIERR